MSIDIEVKCEYCGKSLEAEYRIERAYNRPIIEVSPCETCMERVDNETEERVKKELES